ncbi:MAG TPA: DnaJ family domain-containing protein [Desulfobacterales bacterium]|nr:DnaJ family domain-containing protein [Desulfobacterales bacterium]
MIQGFEKIVEERILKAQKKGDFENLIGSGKPLKLNENYYIPEELRLAYKILKNADCLPPEIELKKEIKQTEDLLAGMQETSEKYRILKKLNFLIMKLNTMRDTSIMNEMPQHYMEKLVRHIEESKTQKERFKKFETLSLGKK